MTVEITVSLHKHLASRASLEISLGKQSEVSLPPGTNVIQLLERLGLPVDYVGLVVINRKQAPLETVLSTGDKVELFPPLSGG